MAFSESELNRYQRQLLIKGWDQIRLKESRILIVGLGGLGGISASYLAAAGVGFLRICDSDVVDASNLNRQILYSSNNIGQSKATQARKRLKAINPDITIEAYSERLTEINVLEQASGCDLLIDGLDNHDDRLLLNKASVELGIPLIYGAIDEWQGQVGFFKPPATGCLTCLIGDTISDSGAIPVFGALPGVIGSIQATMALRYLAAKDESHAGQMLVFSAETMSFEKISFEKNPHCKVCGGK